MSQFTKLLARWIPFDGKYFYYGDDDPATPRQMLENSLAAVAVAALIGSFVLWLTA